MARFTLMIEASVDTAAGADPVLDIYVGGAYVTSSSAITAITGVGSDLLVFTLDFDDSINDYPSSLSFQFSGSSGNGNETVTIENVRINGQAVNTGSDLTATILTQGQTSSLSSPSSLDYMFGRADPTLSDFGSTTQSGTGGADEITGSGGEDIIDGGGGNDRIRGVNHDDAINGGGGNDIIYGEAGNDALLGGNGNDRLFGGEGDDMLHGQNNNDTLFGEAGNDLLNGGSGNDVLIAGSGDDILYGEDGDDRLIGQTGSNSMYGDAGDDLILGGNGNDLIYGGADNDTIHGGNGDDEIYGEDGDEFITGGSGSDTIDGGAGADEIYGGTGIDTISGGANNDALFGDEAADTLNGDGGDDNLVGGDGADTLNGGTGDDLLQGSGLTAYEVSAILQGNSGVVFSEETNSFYQLVSSNVTFAGAQGVAGATTLSGVAGHLVTISSAIENDFVYNLAAGNDIWLNASDASVEGEWRWAGGEEDGLLLWNGDASGSAANGFYSNWNTGQPDDSGGEDAAEMRGSDGRWNDLDGSSNANYYIIEWDGADFSDDNSDDTLNGGDDDDLLLGNGGADTLNGDAGIDHLFGGAGNDDMYGGADGDFLYDDEGANEFYGGDGDDVLDARFQTAIPSVADQITTYLAENPNLTYSSDTGNFYEVVNNTLDWFEARTAAAATTLNGISGHLATITSQEEHDFIVTLAIGNNTWLGGTDDGTITGGVEGEWYWVEGPEAGTHFSTGGTAEPGQFTDWNPGQPNDSDGYQDYLYLLNSNNGWADLAFEGDGTPVNGVNYVTVPQYLVEWEGSDVLVNPPSESPQSAQYMEGGAGDDIIYGGNGDDTIYGDDSAGLETGADYIEAGDGDDTIYGGDDDDEIYGELGSDDIEGGDGDDTIYAAFASGASSIPISATFDGGSEGFTYVDGVFGSSGSSNNYADGTHQGSDGGASNGSLEIVLGGIDSSTINTMTGAWQDGFTLTSAMDSAQLSFSYRAFNSGGNNLDSNEDFYIYVDIDGTLYGVGGNNYVLEEQDPNSGYDSGWVSVTVDIGSLSTGAHTLSVGAEVTRKNRWNEEMTVRFDDMTLQNSSASSTSDGSATNTIDGGNDNDTIYGSDGTDTLLGGAGDDTIYSGSATSLTASYIESTYGVNYDSGTGNFYQYVSTGANYTTASANATASTIEGISGHLATITSSAEQSFVWGLTGSTSVWGGGSDAAVEGAWRWIEGPESGTQFWSGGPGGSAVGGAYTNWIPGSEPYNSGGSYDYFILYAPNGGQWYTELVTANYDYVIEWEGADVFATASAANTTTLNGGSGADQLYGSDGTDLFVFDSNGGDAFTNPDTIHDFDEADNDSIDISDILSGLGVNAGNLSNFVDIDSANGVRIDVTGSGSFAGNEIATFSGSTTISDEATLLAGGQLVI